MFPANIKSETKIEGIMPGAKALSASHCYARDPQSMARSLDPLSLAFLEAAFPEYKLDHCVEHQLSHCVTH